MELYSNIAVRPSGGVVSLYAQAAFLPIPWASLTSLLSFVIILLGTIPTFQVRNVVFESDSNLYCIQTLIY
jgi:hypothetical protein